MCVVSMIMDHYGDKWGPLLPQPQPYTPFVPFVPMSPPPITPAEIDEFRKLLERAREYDKRNNEPDCELEEKKRKVKELADALGIGYKIDFL